MTNDQVLNLQSGDYISQTTNGRIVNYEVLEVRKTGRCVNERSGAYNHAYACVTLQYQGSKLVVDTSLSSDEYISGEGYKTHEGIQRVTGWEVIGHNCQVA